MLKPDQKDMFVELEEVAAPVAEYLRKEFNPHATAIITCDSVKIVMDEVGVPLNKEERSWD